MASLNGPTITGDLVRFTDDERLDIPDARALQTLITATLNRLLGGLVGGWASAAVNFVGCFHAPSATWDGGTKTVTFGAGILLDGGTLASPSGSPGARAVMVDPTLSGQTVTVDLTSYSPATNCLIWAKRTYTSDTVPGVPVNLDTRAQWDVASGTESPFSTYTRFGERVSFVASPATVTSGLFSSATYPGAGYFPIFRVTWSAGTPTFDPIMFTDGLLTGTTAADATVRTKIDAATSGTSYSLGYMLREIRNNVAYIRDQTGATNWADDKTTYRGLKQLDTDLDIVETRTGFGVVTAFSIYKPAATWIPLYPATYGEARIAGTAFSTGTFGFTLDTAFMVFGGGPFSYVTAVCVTLANDGSVAPTVTPTPTIQIIDSATGQFTVRFWDSGVLTDPDIDGFTVTVYGF